MCVRELLEREVNWMVKTTDFQVISDCYEEKTLIITSNLEFCQMMFPNTAGMVNRSFPGRSLCGSGHRG